MPALPAWGRVEPGISAVSAGLKEVGGTRGMDGLVGGRGNPDSIGARGSETEMGVHTLFA